MANIALFYFIAQVIERIMELIDWITSFFMKLKKEKDEQRMRKKMIGMWFLACFLAFAFCYLLDLNMMARLDLKINIWIDKVLTAIVIGSGTKPIHDILSLMTKGKYTV